MNDLTVNVHDYLTDEQIAEVCKEEIQRQIRMQFENNPDGTNTRLISNISYYVDIRETQKAPRQAEAETGEVVHGCWVYKRRRSGGFRIRKGLLKNWERVEVLIDEREDTMEPFWSVCGTHNDSTNDKNMRYCPCCGAKMDGEAQNEKPKG